jgi:biopolymer transport protein ExbB
MTLALVMLSQAAPSSAQQTTGGAGVQPPPAPAAAAALPPPAPAQPPAPVPAASVQPSGAAIPLAQPQPVPALPEVPAAAQDSARPIAGIGNLRELSPWSMFLSADILVKSVMISLVFASLVTWTILLAKTIQLFHARRQLTVALSRIADSRSLGEAQLALGGSNNVLCALLSAAAQEIHLSADSVIEGGIKERVASRFSDIVRMDARAIRYGMGVVATIGATAPFVGLFGTVWGIMDSFIGISKAQTTNLAVVAPGIAEALLATAIGLAAAIPAVIIYNHFARVTKGYMDLVGRGSGAVGRLLSRDLDRYQGKLISRAAE